MKDALDDEHDLDSADVRQNSSFTKPDDNEKILLLQQQLSEANLASEQQVHEIAKLKTSMSRQEGGVPEGWHEQEQDWPNQYPS